MCVSLCLCAYVSVTWCVFVCMPVCVVCVRADVRVYVHMSVLRGMVLCA